jgi:hypothetical protein
VFLGEGYVDALALVALGFDAITVGGTNIRRSLDHPLRTQRLLRSFGRRRPPIKPRTWLPTDAGAERTF